MSPAGAGREKVKDMLRHREMNFAACGLAVGLRAGVGHGGPKRARMGAKDPRPVWIGAGVGAYLVVWAAIQHCQRSDQETVYFLHRLAFACRIASAWVVPVTKSNCIAFSPHFVIFSSSDRSAKGNRSSRIIATINTTPFHCIGCRRHQRRPGSERKLSW